MDSIAPPVFQPLRREKAPRLAAWIAVLALLVCAPVSRAETETSGDPSKTWASRCTSEPAAGIVLGDCSNPVETQSLVWFDSFVSMFRDSDALRFFSTMQPGTVVIIR